MAHSARGKYTTDELALSLSPRPWPPQRLSPRGEAAVATVRELLRDYRECPPPGLESGSWLVVAPGSLATELKTGVLEGSLLVADPAEWKTVENKLPSLSELALLRVDLAPPDWHDMLPDGAPEPEDLECLGELHAFSSELKLSAARVVSLHVWRTGGQEPRLVPEVSGPLLLEQI